MSGLVADAGILIEKARVEAQHHSFSYNEPMKPRSIAQAVADVVIGFGKGKDMPSRPFGVALLMAGVDEEGPQLYHVGPAGSYTEWTAKAIGSGAEGAQNSLQEEYNKDISLDEALKLSVKILKNVMEEKIAAKNVEIATVTQEHGYKVMNNEDLARLIETIA